MAVPLAVPWSVWVCVCGSQTPDLLDCFHWTPFTHRRLPSKAWYVRARDRSELPLCKLLKLRKHNLTATIIGICSFFLSETHAALYPVKGFHGKILRTRASKIGPKSAKRAAKTRHNPHAQCAIIWILGWLDLSPLHHPKIHPHKIYLHSLEISWKWEMTPRTTMVL